MKLRLQRAALIAALFGGALLVSSSHARSVEEDNDMLVENKTSDFGEIAAVIERHPLDYFAFGHAGAHFLEHSDLRAVTYLNHALTLHPTHPGLHRLAARLLVSRDRNAQAAIEYGLAIDGTTRPHSLLTEIVAMLPTTTDAAAAIPVDYANPETILRSLTQLKREDISIAWLVRILESPRRTVVLTDRLYDLAMGYNMLDIALLAAKTRMRDARTTTSRLMLGKVQLARKEYDQIQIDLADVKSWRGRTDEQGDAWLVLCDSFRAQQKWNEALDCLHHLDGSGLIVRRREEIVRRETDIADHRATEVRLMQIQALEKSLKLPIDTELPVIHKSDNSPNQPPKPPTSPITNPLIKPTNPDRKP